MWKNQLKVGSRSFIKPKVKLNVDPDEDKCCEEAKEMYINGFLENVDPSRRYKFVHNLTPKEYYESMFKGRGNASRSCEEFRRWLGSNKRSGHPPLQEILDEWEECENGLV